ncbi:glycoside hydrolase family 16 protein [Amycolatopsis alkalitolerans]|uniref:Glycoside hydrolase family 16 protein n=1 Tax=Amycolatopsis alkalitolerans TaxID=2547244 RepID=A0A5C4M6N6_9PSEU|nr:glycoside hydrolase family 16 protein [Amycolatopsis alkalitolerans]TNC26457.1 glycoside hydrolase family 16 protein [Amycolatopsis alkalitolerans]
MKRRVIVLVVGALLAVGAVFAVRATAERFGSSDAQEAAPTLGSSLPSVIPTRPSTGEAALNLGWQRIDGDEFDGAKVDTTRWRVYDGYNAASKETLSAKQCSVSGGVLTITGLANAAGTTCGMAWKQNRTFGRWEVRARFPAPADAGFNPVFLLWPADDANWAATGEIDFAEEYDTARQYVQSWLHGPGNTDGGYYQSHRFDMTQWHNYAVDWQPDRITLYLDGQPWGAYLDRPFIPQKPMHLVIQQNYNRKHPGIPLQSSVQIDWVRIYR